MSCGQGRVAAPNDVQSQGFVARPIRAHQDRHASARPAVDRRVLDAASVAPRRRVVVIGKHQIQMCAPSGKIRALTSREVKLRSQGPVYLPGSITAMSS